MKVNLLEGLSIALVSGLFALSPSAATAGEYVVAQCHDANRAHEAKTDSADRGDYAMRDECAAAPDYALKVIPNSGASSGHRGYWYWQAPAGTRIVAVDVEAKLRRDSGHKARLYVADEAGQQIAMVASGTDGPANFTDEHWTAHSGSSGAARFYAALVCDNNGATCPAPSEAKTYVRHVQLTLRDVSAPTVAISGDATTSGWKRGDVAAQAQLTEIGGGLVSRVDLVNGVVVTPSRVVPCSLTGAGLAVLLMPCPASGLDEDLVLASARPPFRDGSNELIICAYDFARNTQPNVGCKSENILVDNTPPSLGFKNEQSVEDPELIRATAVDASSGLAEGSGQIEYRQVGSSDWAPVPTTMEGGELQARVNSEDVPPGKYEFLASAKDLAGNEGATLLRSDQTPMTLDFPLKEEVEVDAFFPGGQVRQLAEYRQPSRVLGFLRDDEGSGIPDQRIFLDEQFDDGSLVQQRTESVRTDATGAFHSAIPGGPSRLVSVSYDGSSRYMPDTAPSLDFNVRSHVALSVDPKVRAGDSVRFKGKVGRYFARVPAGGKLVELQFKKKAKTWNTADEATGTSSQGRITVPYRFRRFYEEPVTFDFRLKVTRESGWPYRVPASSKPVEVTVVPRDG